MKSSDRRREQSKVLSPKVKMHKLPDARSWVVPAWVVPDLTVTRELAVDINSNVHGKGTPKNNLPEEAGAQEHDLRSSGLFIRKSVVRQYQEDRADEANQALMADLSQNINNLCETSGEGDFIGPEPDPTELADQSVEEIGRISGGVNYEVRGEEMRVSPNPASQAEEPQKEQHGGQSIVRWFD